MRKPYLTLLSLMVFILGSFGFVQAQTNILTNGDLETITPNFWEKLNGDAELIWASDSFSTAWANSRRSLKIVKNAASADVIGWRSVNNAKLYWNNAGNAGADTYDLSFAAKTEGVNTNPANDDEKIGALYSFYANGSLLAEKLVAVDQSTASTNFTDYKDALYVSGTPDEVYVELIMGKNATGTVWFDNIGCNTNAGWTMGVFNGDCEIPTGWMNWSTDHGFANFVSDTAHSGSHSALLEENDSNDDEMVFYSEPVPVEAGKWYKFGVWIKNENLNTDTTWMATNVTPERDNNRAGITFFFHKAPIKTNWDIVGGDQFFYIDQRIGKENQDWTHYSVVAKAPEEAAGVSMRARLTSFPTGKVWYDDFTIEEFTPGSNILTNGDLETITPNFWEKLNGDAELIWASDSFSTAWANSRRSLKIVKSASSADVIGWRSVNNAKLYWNNAGNAGADTYDLSFAAKTEGVNTNPANDDEKIGALYSFYANGSLLAEKLVSVDQSTASTNFTDYKDALYVSGTPDEVYVELIMGKNATGTVWFDNIGCNTNAGWTMGVFNGDCEIPAGWMNWSTDHGFANFVSDTAHSGSHSALLEENDSNDDEMVFYSEPAPAEAGKFYLISGWTKTEGISTADGMFASNVTPDRDNDRIGYTFFFHKAPIKTNWDLVGGDQFFYIDQRTGMENQDWTQLMAIAQAPEEAAGVSVRARFTSFPTGKVWYDDFSIQEVSLVPTSIEDYGRKGVNVATEYMLQNNYPNPFNPLTTIEYYVPKSGHISLVVYNVTGQKVRTLVEGQRHQGVFQAIWDGRDDSGNLLSSGMYFYQLKGKNAVITKKMTFLK